MTKVNKTEAVVDSRGTFCPVPILLAARTTKGLSDGDYFELIGDDPGIVHDLPAWCEANGHRLVEVVKEGDTIRGIVEIRAPSALDPKESLD